jgi:hypothetical protein
MHRLEHPSTGRDDILGRILKAQVAENRGAPLTDAQITEITAETVTLL